MKKTKKCDSVEKPKTLSNYLSELPGPMQGATPIDIIICRSTCRNCGETVSGIQHRMYLVRSGIPPLRYRVDLCHGCFAGALGNLEGFMGKAIDPEIEAPKIEPESFGRKLYETLFVECESNSIRFYSEGEKPFDLTNVDSIAEVVELFSRHIKKPANVLNCKKNLEVIKKLKECVSWLRSRSEE